MKGPLGALPALSKTTRRALIGCVALAILNAAALVTAAWSLSTTLAALVAGHGVSAELSIFGAAVLARALINWASQTVAARAAAGTKAELRAQLLDTALTRGPEWIDTRHPAELTALATGGLDALDDYFTRFLPALVNAAIVTPLVGLAVLLFDWRSAVLIAITVPLIPLFAALIGRFTKDRVAAAADAGGRLATQLLELLRALPVLTAFGRASAQSRAVEDLSERHRQATGKTLRVAFLSAFALDVIATLSVALVAVDIGLRLLGGEVGLGVALTVLILTPECYLPMRAAGAAFHASEDGMEAVDRVATIVGAEGRPVPEGVRPDDLRHQLDITDLKVNRRSGMTPNGLTIKVRPGKITRLNGPSGSGKSTTFATLLGFIKPTTGHITVDGTDLSKLNMNEWRTQTAWVPQHPKFTATTVAQELALAAPNSKPTSLTDDIQDREIATLSSGERQRVAVARALGRLEQGAWLLLLDEPAAHLDATTASRITEAITEAAANGAAVLLATHTELPQETLAEQPQPKPHTMVQTSAAKPPPLRNLINARLVVGTVLGALALGAAIALTATAAWLIATAAGHPSIVVLTVAIIGVRAFGLAKGALRYAERLVTHDAAFRLATKLRVGLWQSMVRIGPARTMDLRQAEGLNRLVADTNTVRDLVPRVLTPPLTAILVCAGAVAIQTVLLPAAGAVLCVALLVAGATGPLLGLMAERKATTKLAAGRRKVNKAVLNLLEAAADLIANGVDEIRRTQLAKLDAELATTARRQAWGAGITTGIATAALGAAALTSTALAAAAGLNPVLTTVLALIPLAMPETIENLGPALKNLNPLREAYAKTKELDNIPTIERTTKTGNLALTNVTIKWPESTEPVLREVNIQIEPGTELAVMGPSGAGKSTLVALLLGFLQPTEGRATIPEKVAWSPPEPMLSATTIRENLRVGDPTADDEKMKAALKMVALEEWVDRLDAKLGPGGAGASGGEAQRLSLARVILGAPRADMIVLDEPTAHLDEKTAEKVLAGLRKACEGKTIIHVTHRPTEARAAKTIAQVNKGKVHTTQMATTA